MCFSKRTIKIKVTPEEDIKYLPNDTLVVLNMTTGQQEVITPEEFLKKYGP